MLRICNLSYVETRVGLVAVTAKQLAVMHVQKALGGVLAADGAVLGAVSYTHLDVYKRQRRSNGSGGGKHAFTYARTWEDEPEEDEANLFTAELTQLHN